MWFKKLTGITESNWRKTKKNFSIENNKIISEANGRSIGIGENTTPSLFELNKKSSRIPSNGRLHVKSIISDAQSLHKSNENNGALFQVASQFNLLEMIHPSISPEDGIDIYDNDPTQGPACAIAVGGSTIYRNYFLTNGNNKQIDCIEDLHLKLNSLFGFQKIWEMKNGYLFISEENLKKVNKKILNFNDKKREIAMSVIRYGLVNGAEVTLDGTSNFVSQIFCSALPISYNNIKDKKLWEPFARLILDAAYEATLAAALLNKDSNKVFLTLIGLGAFGNEEKWVIDAIERALNKYKKYNLEVIIVNYRNKNLAVDRLVSRFN